MDTLRGTAETAIAALEKAITDLNSKRVEIKNKQIDVESATEVRLAATISCKEEEFDTFTATLIAATTKREADLAAIKTLIEGQTKPARGA